MQGPSFGNARDTVRAVSSQARIARTDVRTALARLRVAAGLTQKQLADAAEIPLTTYSRLEHGDVRKPNAGHLVRLAHVLGCEVESLLSPKPGDASDAAYVQPVGRARGGITAARHPAVSRPRWSGDTAEEHRPLIDAAIRAEDFQPFLDVAQAGTPEAEALLASTVPASLARLAVRQQREGHGDELVARIRKAGIPARRVGAILDGAVRLAQQDLERAFDWHLELGVGQRWPPVASADYTRHAYALLDAEAAKLVGEPHDERLLTDEWPALRP